MADDQSFQQTGIVVPSADDLNDNMDELAHAILDDIVYNIIHDIVLKTHRDEKIARASSAAIRVEQLAAEADPASLDGPSEDSKSGKIETEAAVYKDGAVYLKGNPLKTTREILCSKCGLPRLQHPTDGKGARKPDPGVEYCKRRPFIDKPYYDIYGQTFVPEGPGRGKKKKDMINPLKQQAAADGDTPGGSQDSGVSSPAEGKPIAFPHAKCHNCNTFLPIKRMNNHMVKCIGGGGRDSSRTALLKIQNGNGSAGQNGGTPPGSRHATPLPASSSQTNKKSSPNKREADDEFESDGTPQKKKKIIKKLQNNLKVNKLKAPKMAKTGSQQSSSNLSFEYKAPNSDDEDEDGEDENDGEYGGTVVVEPKKKQKIKLATAVKEKEALKKKWLLGKGGRDPQQKITPVLPPKKLTSIENGHGGSAKSKMANGDMESESSQTLSSPS